MPSSSDTALDEGFGRYFECSWPTKGSRRLCSRHFAAAVYIKSEAKTDDELWEFHRRRARWNRRLVGVEHSGQASQSRRSLPLSAGLDAASRVARSSTSATDVKPNCIVSLTVSAADSSWCSAQHVRRATTGGVEFKRRSKCLIRHTSCLELP